MVAFLSALTVATCTALAFPAAVRPSVGAIRWDGWWSGNPWERNLASPEWRARLPFYARIGTDGSVEVRSDSQRVLDREIRYAARGGLDYWAFCYYHPSSWPEADRYNYGWKLFLSSKVRSRLGFCFILQGGQHLGPASEWKTTAAELAAFFAKPTYYKVCGGRPLLYVFGCQWIEPHFGSAAAARAAFDELRRASQRAGAGDPYIVAQVFSAEDGARYVDAFGWDAIGAYSAPGGGEHREYPYAKLTEDNLGYWNRFAATGMNVVPLVNAGWDGRPRLDDPKLAANYRGPWYAQPQPAELADHVVRALDWVRTHPAAAPADTVLIYAWNESDEGGWLTPTLLEGTRRLDAIARALKNYDRKPRENHR